MVSYPLSDDGERSFVDVSAIPFNAVDTVEVLKDGTTEHGAMSQRCAARQSGAT
jgi:hypothetical protein